MKRDLYRQVTDQIIAELEQGVRPWVQPWTSSGRPLRHNGQAYSGINVLLLWMAAMERGYTAPHWMTYKQAQEQGGQVRKGEKGSPVVYFGTINRETETAAGEREDRAIPFLKTYTVFNVQQIDNLPEHVTATEAPLLSEDQRITAAEAFVAATGAQVDHGGDGAFYAPGPDRVQMPPFASFRSPAAYYATLAHELVHWVGHSSRLDRLHKTERFGDEAFAIEELVAELGAAFLCADLALEPQIREDHAPYISHWLKALRNDRRAVFTAAAEAQRAVDYLHGLQPAGTAA